MKNREKATVFMRLNYNLQYLLFNRRDDSILAEDYYVIWSCFDWMFFFLYAVVFWLPAQLYLEIMHSL